MRGPHDFPAPAALHPVHEAATEWLLRLREPGVTPEEILDWQTWMREDARHAEAFRRMEEVEVALTSVPRPLLPERRGFAVSEWIDRARPLALAASILAALAALGGVLHYLASSRMGNRPALTFATGVGENRAVRLVDGSTVMLGGDSRIEVRYRADERDIDLTRGEAFFTVAHDRARPLRVSAGRAVVTAVGTEFDVRCGTDRVVVNVVEGRVRVEPRVSFMPIHLLSVLEPKLAPVAVSAGQETTVYGSSIEPAVQSSDPAAAIAWTSGRLAFRMQPLTEVLEEVNRYSQKRIVTEDPAIAALRVTGTVDASNVQGWVASLGSALGIQAREDGGQIVLSRVAGSGAGPR